MQRTRLRRAADLYRSAAEAKGGSGVARLLYVRCDCGTGHGGPAHYYRGETCPFSGWVAPGVREARTAAAAVERTGQPLTVEALNRAGLSLEVLALVMVAEFAWGSVGPAALGTIPLN